LESTNVNVYLDAIQVKVCYADCVANRAIYLGVGVAEDGRKEVLGLWFSEREHTKLWLTLVGGLTGFPDALATVFPDTTVQTCIVHLLRNSLSCASYQEQLALAEALKTIYAVINADVAAEVLEAFEVSELGRPSPDVVRR